MVVEASTNLNKGPWTPVSTNTLTGGTSTYAESTPVASPGTFYRFRTP